MGIFSVLISILVIMFLVRKRFNIGVAMLAGSAVLAVLAPVSIENSIEAIKLALFDLEITWNLILAIVLIGVLGHILKETKAMDIMVDRLLKLIGDPRSLMVVIPGLIGALSVPGGAMMTAPMVDTLGDRSKIGPEHKTGINIIYRHIWYIAFPIIPAMVMAASLAQVSPRTMAFWNLPILAIGVVSSWFILLHRLPGKTKGRWDVEDFKMFMVSVLPLTVILVLFLALGLNFPLSLVCGVVIALFNLPGEKGVLKTGIQRLRTMVLPGIRYQLIFVIIGIMIYKEMLHASSVINSFAQDLVTFGIPMWLLLFILPFLIGFVTGSHDASIGISLPIFIPLLSQDSYMAALVLTYTTATLGYLISPLHLCMILTREYFDAKFIQIYRYTAPVAGVTLLAALVFALLRGV